MSLRPVAVNKEGHHYRPSISSSWPGQLTNDLVIGLYANSGRKPDPYVSVLRHPYGDQAGTFRLTQSSERAR
jgi:hypothetical protein